MGIGIMGALATVAFVLAIINYLAIDDLKNEVKEVHTVLARL